MPQSNTKRGVGPANFNKILSVAYADPKARRDLPEELAVPSFKDRLWNKLLK